MTAFELLQGDCKQVLATLPAGSVQCCITSPPYWGLRDYQTDGQLGLEPTPEEYVANTVAVFREVWRVLRDDGTLWLNLGDSYTSGNRADRDPALVSSSSGLTNRSNGLDRARTPVGLKPKDLVGIPWRVAFALQADGWYLRQDIIWAKPNPMPESVTDRCTKSHEYIFLLAKSAKYYFDNDAIKENSTSFVAGTETNIRFGGNKYGDLEEQLHRTKSGNEYTDIGKRNKRSVWTVSTRPFKEAHFATFPPELIEPCVLASTSHFGMCAECKAPYKRIVERGEIPDRTTRDNTLGVIPGRDKTTRLNSVDMAVIPTATTGWGKTCNCTTDAVEPCVILDPFSGAGTTGVVAIKHSRCYIGTELNPDYVEMSRKRIQAEWDGITLPMF